MSRDAEVLFTAGNRIHRARNWLQPLRGSRHPGTNEAPRGPRRPAQPLDLSAAALTAQRPIAKVLTVVAQQPIAAFTQARPCSLHHFAAIEAWHTVSKPNVAAVREVAERNLLHRAAP